MVSSSHSALAWYTTLMPTDRCIPDSTAADRSKVSQRVAEDLQPILTLPDHVLQHALQQMPVEDLQRLATLSHDALGCVKPLGTPYVKAKPLKDYMPTLDVSVTPSTSTAMNPSLPSVPENAKPLVALDAKKWVDFPLSEREDINHNTRRLRFALPCTDLGLPVGMHIFLKAKDKIKVEKDGEWSEKTVMRAYTPVGSGPGYVEFIIKIYFANQHPRFPHGGALTQYMEKMKVGDCLSFKGPLGEFDFEPTPHPRAPMTFKINNGSPVSYKTLGFIAGGTGITPCLQVANEILTSERDIKIWLLYANQSPDDILCQDMLDAIEKDPRVKVWYTVDRAPDDWKYDVGFIDEDMCRERLPAPSDDTHIFMCGPPPMLKFACRPNLDKLGHMEDHVHSF